MSSSIKNNTNKALLSSLNEVQNHVDIIDDYIITSTTDLNGVINDVSQAFCDISGYSKEELVGKKHSFLRHRDTSYETYKDLWDTITSGKEWHGDIKNIKKNGEVYSINMLIRPLFCRSEKIKGYLAVQKNITNRVLSITDDLTQSYNRRFFNQIFEQEMLSAKKNNQWFGFLMLDVDNFKKYNDAYGHQEGDTVLISIVKSLKKVFIRATDYVFRLGGEEFGVLFNFNQKEEGVRLGEAARKAIEGFNIPHSLNLPHAYVTLSGGLYLLDPLKNHDVKAVYKSADDLLYKAKNRGRNCIEIEY